MEEGPETWQQQCPASLQHLETTDLQQVFSDFPALFQPSPGRTSLLQHVIHLKDPTPIRQRPYRVPERLVGGLKAEIATMRDLGVIKPSTSEWSSPIVILPKKDGTLRVCMDFRKLNAASQFDAYPMPRIEDLLAEASTSPL